MSEASVMIAEQDGVVAVRVLGRATFKVCREFREYAMRVLKSSPTNAVVIDLSECDTMDSTFMGILAMIGLQGRGKTHLCIVGADASNQALLSEIGVSKLWKFADGDPGSREWTELCQAAAGSVDMTASDVGALVLDAHKTLMELDPENVPKFKNVVELLSAEMNGQ
ncbi:MAG: STAS domain-containing protein [Lentisphaeria bacterium]|nr:STAS domain-containing protein [Lentisphaeria bacterium]